MPSPASVHHGAPLPSTAPCSSLQRFPFSVSLIPVLLCLVLFVVMKEIGVRREESMVGCGFFVFCFDDLL